MKPTLSPLQHAAFERVLFFERELEKRGLRVRMSFEQEFSSVHSAAILQKALEPLQRVLPTLLSLGPDHELLEARFGTDHSCRYRPSEVATDVEAFRQHGAQLLSDIIQQEIKALKFLPASGDALLFPIMRGLHVNYSVYDREGNDLFDSTGFRRINAERLMNLQYHAGLAFIQSEENLLGRVGNTTIGLHKEKDVYTVVERRKAFIGKSPSPDYFPDYYLEDRLPPADADPFVMAALHMAAVYDAVTQYPQLRDQSVITKAMVDNAWPNVSDGIDNSHSFRIRKRNMSGWKQQFRKSENQGLGGFLAQHDNYGLRQLLGNDLYEGIAREYPLSTTPSIGS